MGNVDDLLRWLSDYRLELKSSAAMGALPDTAQRNYDTFLVFSDIYIYILQWLN